MSRKAKTDKCRQREVVFRVLLAERRKQVGLTQVELAKRAGLSVDLIRAIECGRSANPSFFAAVDILDVLGVDIEGVGIWAGKKI